MYSCSCNPGYTGLNCENEINECYSNPCKNGGQCVDKINLFSCKCTAGKSVLLFLPIWKIFIVSESVAFLTTGVDRKLLYTGLLNRSKDYLAICNFTIRVLTERFKVLDMLKEAQLKFDTVHDSQQRRDSCFEFHIIMDP